MEERRIIIRQEPQQKTPMEKMAEEMALGVSATVDSIKKGWKKICNLVKRKTKETTATATQTAIATSVSTQTTAVDADRELVLPALTILGVETKEKITFLKQLHVLSGLSIFDIAEGLKCILETEINVEYLLKCSIDDVVVLLKIWKIGRLSGTTDVIYNTIQDVVADRADIWLEKITAAAAAAGAPPAEDATTLEEVLRMYVSWVSDDFYVTIKNEPTFKLLRIVIKLTGGVFLPIETLKMTAVWCVMQNEMQRITPRTEPLIKRGVAYLAMCISMASHVCTEGISSIYGQMITLLSENVPSETKDSFYSFLKRFEVPVKKYLAWNKTVGVLIEKESLNMVGAMRMMTTFKMGRTFIRGLTGNIKLGEYLKDLDPIPHKRTIHDVLSLFRIPSIYNRRVELITGRLDGLVQEKVTDSDIEFAAMCYYELLKLKLAYIPYMDYGKNGGFIDPCDAMVDLSLIDTIATHAFSRINGGLFNGIKRRRFKAHLKERILNSPDQKYLEYFGEPKFILEVIQPITYE